MLAITPLTVVTLTLLDIVFAAPTKLGLDLNTDRDRRRMISHDTCAGTRCLLGQAYLHETTHACACPDNSDILFPHPCIQTKCAEHTEPFYSILDDACICSAMADWLNSPSIDSLDGAIEKNQKLSTRGAVTLQAQTVDPAPDYIPPPKQDITPELLNQSLTLQPQNTATISTIIPYLTDGIFKVFLQLNGLVAEVLVVNASVTFPCGTIGLVNPQPNVALVPKIVQQGQGTPQVVVADCQCIAVNMYRPDVVTYWIQKTTDGTLYSVVGSNKVLGIDKIDTSQSAALSLITLPTSQKRSLSRAVEVVAPEKRQMFATNCAVSCPFYHMHMIQGTDGYCGCIFNSAEQELQLHTRGMKEPDVHTATMTAEACAAMTCFSQGNKPAIYNPFSKTCWCYTEPLIESNPSAWSG